MGEVQFNNACLWKNAISARIINPNFLLKDELQYKLGIRGISSEGEISVLLKLFRSVTSRLFTFQLDYLKSVSVDVWCSCIELKICELQSLVTPSLPSL
jgi:hypothetical protein